MKIKQQSFQDKAFKKQTIFGGSLLKGNARTKRPLSTKLPLHAVLRSRKSALRLPKTYRDVNIIVTTAAKKYGITIYEYANVGNHIHMLMRVPNRFLWAKFIREITGRISSLVQGLVGTQEKGEPFWLHKPYTRVVQGWKKAYQNVKDYIYLNQMEGEGNIKRKEVPTMKAFRALFADDW